MLFIRNIINKEIINMDINFVNQNGNGGVTMQHYELQEIAKYALKWAEISNDVNKNNQVKEVAYMINTKIDEWVSELPK